MGDDQHSTVKHSSPAAVSAGSSFFSGMWKVSSTRLTRSAFSAHPLQTTPRSSSSACSS